mmetsp:Transcript_23907/g.38427  ORF Transcript_23907/g.38427 Transcript_23907/m.38427 type:complete len:115 (+) Transcript_23907:341-685(+)
MRDLSHMQKSVSRVQDRVRISFQNDCIMNTYMVELRVKTNSLHQLLRRLHRHCDVQGCNRGLQKMLETLLLLQPPLWMLLRLQSLHVRGKPSICRKRSTQSESSTYWSCSSPKQ